MDRTRAVLGLLCLACLLASAPAVAQAVYNGGRCTGSYTLFAGDSLTFTPGSHPAADGLWIAVNAGGGYAILLDGAGGQTGTDFAFKQGAVLLFPVTAGYTLHFQGSSMQIFFGGTLLNRPAAPVCDTGLLGPVFLKADRLLNLMTQSQASGTPKLQVWAWFEATKKTSGNITYTQFSQPLQQSQFDIPPCTGTSCCQPSSTNFAFKNLSGGSYTLFELDAQGAYNFDWMTAVPDPLACTASASPASGTAPLDVSFIASASGGSSGYTWLWSFGDGSTSTKKEVIHTYASGGKFTWRMTVTDRAGQTCKKSGTLQVASPLTVAASATPRQGSVPITTVLSASASGAKPPYTYHWDFQDGSTADTATVTHTFVAQGAYDCSVMVTDSAGLSAVGRAPVYAGVPIAPAITSVKAVTSPTFVLKVTGADFQSGCTASIEGQSVPLVVVKSTSALVFKKGKALKSLVPKGTAVCVVVANPDGGQSDCFTYTR